MMDTERDTHFQGFAERLYYKLAALKGSMPPHLNDADWVRAEQKLITQLAYDFALHILENAPVYLSPEPDGAQSWRERLQDLLTTMPDLTQWPTS